MYVLFRRDFRKFLLLLLCWGVALAAHAQFKKKDKDKEKPAPPAQTYRAEIESDSFDEDHWVQPLPDSTLLVITTKRNSWFGKNDFVLTRFDRHLKQVWQTKQEHKPYHDLFMVTAERGKVYLLFSTSSSSKKLLLYQVNTKTGGVTSSEHVLPSTYITINEIAAIDGQVFISGIEKFSLNMLHLNPAQEEIKILPAVFGMEEDLGEFRVDTLTRAVEFVVSESNGLRSRIQAKRMNTKGEVIGTYFIQPEVQQRVDNVLQAARLAPGDTLSKLLIGTFGYRTSIFSKGLYTSGLAGDIKYHDFNKLNHFFDYLGPGAQRRMKAKLARQEAKEKPLVLRYRMLLHPIMPHPQGYALVGEIYYPQYRGDNFNYFNYGRHMPYGMSPEPRRALDRAQGYRFSHVIACVFDKEGNLLWDNSYQLQNNTYPDLAPTVEAGVAPDGSISLLYPEDEFLWYKTLSPNTTYSDEEKVEVRVGAESEKMVSSNNEGISHWYGGNFVAFGFQRIKPAGGDGRTVFYLQNISFEQPAAAGEAAAVK
ncbi:hypothetical protein TH63_01905 [Rufibacter radiotolerans]|uniref:Uncharacterized protein n=1 Tax=Rufibacter radiotolerans TaxID=1379910 RepID=A0A0H4VL86_9BACT|nr:hypothetical protein [Rufibacter radiotolerans]AKQ44662.1 hypothetical protein TH63_01905 [Rufibacter radiotolerans]